MGDSRGDGALAWGRGADEPAAGGRAARGRRGVRLLAVLAWEPPEGEALFARNPDSSGAGVAAVRGWGGARWGGRVRRQVSRHAVCPVLTVPVAPVPRGLRRRLRRAEPEDFAGALSRG
ncbi:hypothetical protein ACIQNU_38210 [Streptomyces sp. NPDC091292]|uniref:hypothetical protein n=1 Tax=Streptomyces sp. NPDC091292 TaxID=3365991 RepID=UPI00381F67BF